MLYRKALSLRRSIAVVAAVLFTVAVPSQTPAQSQSQSAPIQVSIDARKTGAPISRYLYGQFLEHGGDIVNTGVWAEMLVDRKFFYPVSTAAPVPPPVLSNGQGNPRNRQIPTRWWSPIGGDDQVTMDTQVPYTGDHTPLIQLDGKQPHGIAQSGLAGRQGMAYTGRVALAGSPSAAVKVTFVWGPDPGDRQTIAAPSLGAAYRTIPLHFAAPRADTDTARIEIVGTGTGSFHVGAVSLMPANNVEGFRAEVIAALKQLHSGSTAFQVATSSLPTSGGMPWGLSTNGHPSSIRSGTPSSPTTSGPTSS